MQAVTADRIPEPAEGADRRKIWLLAGLAILQLLAFWLLCSHQVRIAEVRRAEWQVQQLALSDCLEYIPGSTIASCANEPATLHAGAPIAAGGATPAAARSANAALAGAMPVSFTLR